MLTQFYDAKIEIEGDSPYPQRSYTHAHVKVFGAENGQAVVQAPFKSIDNTVRLRRLDRFTETKLTKAGKRWKLTGKADSLAHTGDDQVVTFLITESRGCSNCP